MSNWIDLPGTYRGLRAMTRKHERVNYALDFGRRGFWLHLWTPIWHEGRGPYVSIGLGLVRFLRGY